MVEIGDVGKTQTAGQLRHVAVTAAQPPAGVLHAHLIAQAGELRAFVVQPALQGARGHLQPVGDQMHGQRPLAEAGVQLLDHLAGHAADPPQCL